VYWNVGLGSRCVPAAGDGPEFHQIEYKNIALVVLNLRAPSVPSRLQLAGIVGHNFLSHYRVALDMERSVCAQAASSSSSLVVGS